MSEGRKQKPIRDSDKLKVLERIIKNLYHAKDIEYHLRPWNGLEGFITMLDINDVGDIPKINDCCDMGIENDVTIRRTEYDKEMHQHRPIVDCEIWLNENPYATIKELRKELNESKKIKE